MTSSLVPSPGRHPFRELVRVEALLFGRSAAGVVWTALIPLAAVVVLGAVPATRHPSDSFDGHSPLETWLPVLMMYEFLMTAANLLPAVLAGYRERGILRRLSTTPVPPSRLLGAQALIYLALATVLDATMLAIAVGCGVPLPGQFAGFVLTLALVAAAMLGIGLVLAALAPGEKAANALGLVVFFPLLFFAGMWIPRSQMPHVLRDISDVTPLGAGARAVQDCLDGRWPAAAALLVLAAYAVVCGVVAARRFRWQ
ncbi:ABC transporter permease [Frankia sp. AgPm24]|uniref:ABC transporter permease n=1 Tax=Frankia sp. AgPm24 TaxID=631128 RepID=UPI00200C5811|nr:ABC transporter permease [Frankia sp. AgPm24]MCK9924385.1 ABC transporter permease [Frankia sp. AgPm24]